MSSRQRGWRTGVCGACRSILRRNDPQREYRGKLPDPARSMTACWTDVRHRTYLKRGSSDMKVFQRLAQAFKAEGTEAVFGIMGDANMYWYSELDKLGVQLVEVRHEGAGLGMADGWARATHKPGVASATCGP